MHRFCLSIIILCVTAFAINATTFKTYSGKRSYYLPEMSKEMSEYSEDENVYEINSYNVEFPTDGTNTLKRVILKEVFNYNGTSIDSAGEKHLACSESGGKKLSFIPNESAWANVSTVSGNVISQTPSLIVYNCSYYSYMCGAAHGSQGVTYLNYYIPTQRVLTLDDILLKSNRTTITKLLRQQARRVANSYQCLESPQNVHTPEMFYIGNNGVTFVYQEYEIACGADGIIEITLSKKQLAGCLTSLGKKLIK